MSTIKSLLILFVSVFAVFHATAQEPRLFYLEIDPDQDVERINGAPGSKVNVPIKSGIVMLDGAHDTEGLGQSIILNGIRLTIESTSMGLDGWRHVVLRRQDGRDFYDMFPTLKARMIPTTQRPAPDEDKD